MQSNKGDWLRAHLLEPLENGSLPGAVPLYWIFGLQVFHRDKRAVGQVVKDLRPLYLSYVLVSTSGLPVRRRVPTAMPRAPRRDQIRRPPGSGIAVYDSSR